jgi:hypothetical protein
MTTINANTKISNILKQSPEALEAIISISSKFNKLRNPLLRKLIASRTSIATASGIGGCSVNDFFEKLKPLGFEIDDNVVAETKTSVPRPQFMENLKEENIVELDVRPILDGGKDPFQLILNTVNGLNGSQVLKLVNSFEPTPLIQILEKKGFKTYSETINDHLVYTYFYNTEAIKMAEPIIKNNKEDWNHILENYKDNIEYVDVRELEAPLPMLTILEELDRINPEKVLFVYHKRIPVFLLPELQERKFDYLINEISDNEVHLLIFKK